MTAPKRTGVETFVERRQYERSRLAKSLSQLNEALNRSRFGDGLTIRSDGDAPLSIIPPKKGDDDA